MPTVEETLTSLGIDFVLHEHPAVFTCEEAEKYCANIPGLACKNLFLRNRQGSRHFLVVLPATKRADLKKFAEVVGEGKVTFASAEDLMTLLRLEPGSVSPFGLLNDQEHVVELYVDQDVYEANTVSFHPNRNTASLELSREMFQRFLQTIKNPVRVINL